MRKSEPRHRAFVGRVVVRTRDGSELEEEIEGADAHPRGARPFARASYCTATFTALSSEYAVATERDRFLNTALALAHLAPGRLDELNVVGPDRILESPDWYPVSSNGAAASGEGLIGKLGRLAANVLAG